MKKTALLLVLTIVLSLAMTSCQTVKGLMTDVQLMLNKPESALDVWKNIDTRMDSLDSYEANMKMELDFEFEGVKIEGEAVAHDVKVGEYFYESSRQSIKTDGQDEVVSEKMFLYEDGEIYVLHSEGSVYSKLCSNITFDEFEDYYYENASNFILDEQFNKAFKQTFTENEDSTWTIVFDDFAKDAVDEMADELGLEEAIFGKVDDITVEIHADAKYHAKKIILSIYNDTNEDPITVANITFSRFNSAEKVSIDKSDFIKVEDATLTTSIFNSMSNKIDLPNGEFTLSVTHKSYVENGSMTTLLTEFDKVSYDNNYKGDKFSFNIDVDYNNTKMSIAYSDGVMSTRVGANTSKEAATDSEARVFVSQLITSSGFSPYMVKSVTKESDGSYKLVCEVSDTESYKILASEAGIGSFSDYNLYFIVDMEGDEVKVLESHLTIHGTRASYVVDSVFNFTVEENSESTNGGTQV